MTFKKLTYTDVRSINWQVADTIRDKGNGAASDYKNVALPFITLKRFLDMRAEFKQNEILNSDTYEFNDNDLLETLSDFMPLHKSFMVFEDKKEFYDVEFDDIVNYQENPDKNLINYKLGNGAEGRLSINTNAANKVEFLFQVIESFSEPSTIGYFHKTEFEKTSRKILPMFCFDEIVTYLSQYSFAKEFAEEDIFGDAYMDLLGRFAADEGKKGGEFFTPSNLVENGIKLVKPEYKGDKKVIIGDLTAGACTFMTYAAKSLEDSDTTSDNKKERVNNYVQFITQEKTEASELLGLMNMKLHGYDNHISYHGNTITEYKNGFIGDHAGTMDYIYANPPYGLKDYGFEYAKLNAQKESRWQWGVPQKGEGEYAFINTIMDLLNADGKALIALPLGTLFKDATRNIRQQFIERDWIEGIINLPAGMFYTTGIPVCYWIINKNKNEADKRKIFMINSEQEFTKQGNINFWNSEKTLHNYENRIIETGFSEYVDFETLKENDFNLSVSRYVYKEAIKEEIDINLLNNEIEDLYIEILNYRNQNKDLLKGI